MHICLVCMHTCNSIGLKYLHTVSYCQTLINYQDCMCCSARSHGFKGGCGWGMPSMGSWAALSVFFATVGHGNHGLALYLLSCGIIIHSYMI